MNALYSNAGLIVALSLCIAPPLVLALVGLIMHSAGVSLRPLVFIAVLFLPVVIPFVIGQLVIARAPAPAVPAAALSVRDGRFVDREKLFGSGIAPEFIRNAKSGLPGILDEAEVAEVGITSSGESVLIAQFPDEEATKRAAAAYWRGFQLRNTSGDEDNGWRATRMQGDHIELLRTGRQLFVWTGLTQEAAAARRAAQFPSLKPAPPLPLFPSLQPLADFFSPWHVKLIGIVLLVCLYILWFFKGIGWAASALPAANVPAVPVGDLVSRLMAINDLDVPFTITQGESPNELIADWRYADAKWIDLARAHGMRKTFRIRMRIDEAARTVSATDYTAEFDWSAGKQSAGINWRAGKGAVFFQKEQQTVFGLQSDGQGRIKPVISYTYKFDVHEMKAPLITIVTRSGWTWRLGGFF